ncbi:hypothetical protein ACVNF4_24235 [Streptomyces sp. S6]
MALRNSTRRTAGAAAAVVLLLVLSACGGDDKQNRATPAPSPSATRPTAPADTAAAEQAIRTGWTKFFDPRTTGKQRQALLENGRLLAGALQTYNADTAAQGSIEIKKITFNSAKRATVTYTLAGAPKDRTGTSVEQAGIWKISAGTLCGLPKPTSGPTSAGAPVC